MLRFNKSSYKQAVIFSRVYSLSIHISSHPLFTQSFTIHDYDID